MTPPHTATRGFHGADDSDRYGTGQRPDDAAALPDLTRFLLEHSFGMEEVSTKLRILQEEFLALHDDNAAPPGRGPADEPDLFEVAAVDPDGSEHVFGAPRGGTCRPRSPVASPPSAPAAGGGRYDLAAAKLETLPGGPGVPHRHPES